MDFKIGDLVKPGGPWLDEVGQVKAIAEESYPVAILVEDSRGYSEWCRADQAERVQRIF